MSMFEVVNINPFLRDELFPSYSQNKGELYPALVIENTDKNISVYDGILTIDKETIRLSEYKIGELQELLSSKGIETSIYEGTENVDALMLVNFSNSDMVRTEIDRPPIDAFLIKSKNLINNVFDKYSENVDVQIIQDELSSVEIKNNKIYTSSDDIGKDISTSHFAKTFVLKFSNKVLLRDYENVNSNLNVKEALITANIGIKGKDNAGYTI